MVEEEAVVVSRGLLERVFTRIGPDKFALVMDIVDKLEKTMQHTQTGSDTCGGSFQTHRIVSACAPSLAYSSLPCPGQSTRDIPTYLLVSFQT